MPSSRFTLWFLALLVAHVVLLSWFFGWWKRQAPAQHPAQSGGTLAIPLAETGERRFLELLEVPAGQPSPARVQEDALPPVEVAGTVSHDTPLAPPPTAEQDLRKREVEANKAADAVLKDAEIERIRAERERIVLEREELALVRQLKERQDKGHGAEVADHRSSGPNQTPPEDRLALPTPVSPPLPAVPNAVAGKPVPPPAPAAVPSAVASPADPLPPRPADRSGDEKLVPGPPDPPAKVTPAGSPHSLPPSAGLAVAKPSASCPQAPPLPVPLPVPADLAWYDRNILYPSLYRVWESVQPGGGTGQHAPVAVRIAVRPDGKVAEKSMLTGSGDARTDAAVRKALRRLDQVPPLPRSFQGRAHVQILILP